MDGDKGVWYGDAEERGREAHTKESLGSSETIINIMNIMSTNPTCVRSITPSDIFA